MSPKRSTTGAWAAPADPQPRRRAEGRQSTVVPAKTLSALAALLAEGEGPLQGDAATKAEQTLGSALPRGVPKLQDLYIATKREF